MLICSVELLYNKYLKNTFCYSNATTCSGCGHSDTARVGRIDIFECLLVVTVAAATTVRDCIQFWSLHGFGFENIDVGTVNYYM